MCKINVLEKSNSELLAMLLGIKAENIKAEALSDVVRSPRAIEGVGEAREAKLYALGEVARRLMEAQPTKRTTIHGPEDAAAVLVPRTRYENKEHFMAMFLDSKNHILAIETISTGSLSASIVHPREVFAAALKYPTAAMIVAHNHPSGDPGPSREDIAVTERLVKAGKIMDIPVLDHIILGDARWMSMKERGNM